MTETTMSFAPAELTPEKKYSWAIPLLLGLAVLLAMLGSLCIGAYPTSFWRVAQILVHLALPLPLPQNPPWNLKELTVVQIIRLPACCSRR